MTVSTLTSRVVYAGDGVTISFSVPFIFIEDGHIAATLRDDAGVETPWELGTQYNLSGAESEAGGTLTVRTSPTDYTPAIGETLVIRRVVPETQGTDYPEGGEFPAKAHEQALDKLTMIAHQHAERLDRALQVPASDMAASLDLPIDSDRAGKFLAFDGTGNPIAAAGTSADLAPVSSYIDTLLDDADSDTALATLQALKDVLTSRGDLVVEGAAGPQRLAIGSPGYFLGSDGADPAWLAPNCPEGWINGLILSKSADQKVDIGAGLACADDGMSRLHLTTPLTKQINTTWAAGDDAGGLDTGTIANETWYHVFAIGKADGSVDALFSTSFATPVLPSGYALKRRIGSILTDGSGDIVAFTQVGDEFMWADPPEDLDTSSLGTTSMDVTLSVPIDVPVLAVFNALGQRVQLSVVIRPKSQDDEAPSDSDPPFSNLRGFNTEPGSAASFAAGQYRMMTDASARIAVKASAASTDLSLATTGWVDPRGRSI